MFINEAVRINSANHLEIGGCDCVDLAKEFGTPLYVMDEGLIRKNCRIFRNAIDEYLNGNGLVLYASKAFSSMAMYRILHQEGLGIDVVSGGELYTALKAGFPMERVYFHGNNKTVSELAMAIDNNVGRIVVDNMQELCNINKIAAGKNKTVSVSFRIKPGVEAHTYEFCKTGQTDSKFGIDLEDAFEIFEEASLMKNIRITGIHCHIGSQILSLEPYKLATEIMLEFAVLLKDKLGVEIQELNVGGGFGIKYVSEDVQIDFHKYIEAISETVKSFCSQNGIKVPFILLEPGRSIVGAAGITLYTVGNIKEIKGIRKYVSVDGGMTDNPRYALYGAKYDGAVANRADAPKVEKVTIAGKCCESGDLIGKDMLMPKIEVGDILAIFATGAYNYSMSSNYNRIPRPAVVLARDGKARVIVKREDYNDIIRNDIIPGDL